MNHPIPPKPLAELRAIVTAQQAAQQRVLDYIRACAFMLGLDPDDPKVRFNVQAGYFEAPDPPAVESPAAPLPSDNAPPVPVPEP